MLQKGEEKGEIFMRRMGNIVESEQQNVYISSFASIIGDKKIRVPVLYTSTITEACWS